MRFNIGDTVRVRKNYVGYVTGIPENTEGVIVEINPRFNHLIYVEWENGTSGKFREEENILRLKRRK